MSEPNENDVVAEVRAWLKANWNPELSLIEWRSKLADSGWGMPHWPKQWHGRGLPVRMLPSINDEFVAVGAVGAAATGPRILASVTLLEHASDAVKQRFLRRIVTGEDGWCQLFSEPGSGSDLAGATTRADFDGTQWIVNGQKVWNTSAHHADYGLLVARTDWDAPKHQGLTYFVLDMRQPGVQVLPLKQMNGHASFNQVFFTDAKIPADWIVGTKNNGWAVAMTTLAHERRPAVGVAGVSGEGRTGRAYAEARIESRNRQRAVQVVSAARRTRRSRGAAREEDRRVDRSGDPSGNRQAADDVAQHELDGAPRRAPHNASATRRVRRVRSANSPAATSRARRRSCTR